MEKRNKRPQYGYRFALNNYNLNYKNFEVKKDDENINAVSDSQTLIIRLDGKAMTSKFNNKEELYSKDLKYAMKYMMENLFKNGNNKYIKFAYSYSDEISILLEANIIKNYFNNNAKQLLTYFEIFISKLFNEGLNKTSSEFKNIVFKFDSRYITIDKNKVINYFKARQYFAINQFLDKIKNIILKFKYKQTANYLQIIKQLDEKGINYYKYPLDLRYGIIGYKLNNRWYKSPAKEFALVENWLINKINYEAFKSNKDYII